ncbi:hypothetical protein FDECE_8467 [Fusarium decemcellulare]|nr:hypothetical protein FDECE_8467 [Fusarium decemcellulare]
MGFLQPFTATRPQNSTIDIAESSSDSYQEDVLYHPLVNPDHLSALQPFSEFGSSASGRTHQGPVVRGGKEGEDFQAETQNDSIYPAASSSSRENTDDKSECDDDDTVWSHNGKRPSDTRLACLFHKANPRRYQECEHFILSNWDRVLQHTKRLHLMVGVHCPKCRLIFEGKDADRLRNEHLRSESCADGGIEGAGWLREVEYDSLKRFGSKLDDKGKWYRAWKALFPRLQPPEDPHFKSLADVLRHNAPLGIYRVLEPWLARRGIGGDDSMALANDLAKAAFKVPIFATVGFDTVPVTPSQAPLRALGLAPAQTSSWRQLSQVPNQRPVSLPEPTFAPRVLYGQVSQALPFDSSTSILQPPSSPRLETLFSLPHQNLSIQDTDTYSQNQSALGPLCTVRNIDRPVGFDPFNRFQGLPDWPQQVSPSSPQPSLPSVPGTFNTTQGGLGGQGPFNMVPAQTGPPQYPHPMGTSIQQILETPPSWEDGCGLGYPYVDTSFQRQESAKNPATANGSENLGAWVPSRLTSNSGPGHNHFTL